MEVNTRWFIQANVKVISQSLFKDAIYTTDTIYKEPMTRWKSIVCDSSKECEGDSLKIPSIPRKCYDKVVYHRVYLKVPSMPPDTIYKEPVTRWKSIVCDSSKQMWISQSLFKDAIYTTDTIYKEPVTRWKSIVCDSSKEMWRWYHRVYLKMISMPQT